jgi:hypothetical protein
LLGFSQESFALRLGFIELIFSPRLRAMDSCLRERAGQQDTNEGGELPLLRPRTVPHPRTNDQFAHLTACARGALPSINAIQFATRVLCPGRRLNLDLTLDTFKFYRRRLDASSPCC